MPAGNTAERGAARRLISQFDSQIAAISRASTRRPWPGVIRDEGCRIGVIDPWLSTGWTAVAPPIEAPTSNFFQKPG